MLWQKCLSLLSEWQFHITRIHSSSGLFAPYGKHFRDCHGHHNACSSNASWAAKAVKTVYGFLDDVYMCSAPCAILKLAFIHRREDCSVKIRLANPFFLRDEERSCELAHP